MARAGARPGTVPPATHHPAKGQRVDISHFGADGHLPLGVAFLLAAVLGVLFAVIAAPGRRMQQPNAARRNRRIGPRVRCRTVTMVS